MDKSYATSCHLLSLMFIIFTALNANSQIAYEIDMSVFGLPQTATAAEVRRAYRQRVKLLMPKVNQNHKPALQKLTELNLAYENLRAWIDRDHRESKIAGMNQAGPNDPLELFARIKERPYDSETALRVYKLMQSEYLSTHPHLIDELLKLPSSASKNVATGLVLNPSLRSHQQFQSWVERVFTIQGSHSKFAEALSEARPNLFFIRPLLIYIESIETTEQVRALNKSLTDQPEHLKFYKPALRVLYRSSLFAEYAITRSQEINAMLKLFGTTEPELTRAYQFAKTSADQTASFEQIQLARLSSEESYFSWLASRPFVSPERVRSCRISFGL